MKQDSREYSNYVDKAWSSMEVILDREMPQKKKRRFAFWWFGVGFMLLLGVSLFGYVQLRDTGEALAEISNSQPEADQPLAESSTAISNSQTETDNPLTATSSTNQQIVNDHVSNNKPIVQKKISTTSNTSKKETTTSAQLVKVQERTQTSTKTSLIQKNNEVTISTINSTSILANAKERNQESANSIISENDFSEGNERPQQVKQVPISNEQENGKSILLENNTTHPIEKPSNIYELLKTKNNTKSDQQIFQFPFIEVLEAKGIHMNFKPLPLLVALDKRSEEDPVIIDQKMVSNFYLGFNLNKNTKNTMYGLSPSFGIAMPISRKLSFTIQNEWSYLRQNLNNEVTDFTTDIVNSRVDLTSQEENDLSASNLRWIISTSLDASLAYQISGKWNISSGIGFQYPLKAGFNDLNLDGSLNADPDLAEPLEEEDTQNTPLGPSANLPSDFNFSLDQKLLPYATFQIGYDISKKWNINLGYNHHFSESYSIATEPINFSKVQLGIRVFFGSK